MIRLPEEIHNHQRIMPTISVFTQSHITRHWYHFKINSWAAAYEKNAFLHACLSILISIFEIFLAFFLETPPDVQSYHPKSISLWKNIVQWIPCLV